MDKIIKILKTVQNEKREALLEHEVYEIFSELGIRTPNFKFIGVTEKTSLKLSGSSSEVVIKVVSPEILHKTELGGVVFCNNNEADISTAIQDIRKRTAKYDVRGFLVV